MATADSDCIGGGITPPMRAAFDVLVGSSAHGGQFLRYMHAAKTHP